MSTQHLIVSIHFPLKLSFTFSSNFFLYEIFHCFTFLAKQSFSFTEFFAESDTKSIAESFLFCFEIIFAFFVFNRRDNLEKLVACKQKCYFAFLWFSSSSCFSSNLVFFNSHLAWKKDKLSEKLNVWSYHFNFLLCSMHLVK